MAADSLVPVFICSPLTPFTGFVQEGFHIASTHPGDRLHTGNRDACSVRNWATISVMSYVPRFFSRHTLIEIRCFRRVSAYSGNKGGKLNSFEEYLGLI